MKLNLQDLEKIADLTLEHYNQRAEEFWEGILAARAMLPEDLAAERGRRDC